MLVRKLTQTCLLRRFSQGEPYNNSGESVITAQNYAGTEYPGNRVYSLLLSVGKGTFAANSGVIKGGEVDYNLYSHYGMLRMVEHNWSLGNLGMCDHPSTAASDKPCDPYQQKEYAAQNSANGGTTDDNTAVVEKPFPVPGKYYVSDPRLFMHMYMCPSDVHLSVSVSRISSCCAHREWTCASDLALSAAANFETLWSSSHKWCKSARPFPALRVDSGLPSQWPFNATTRRSSKEISASCTLHSDRSADRRFFQLPGEHSPSLSPKSRCLHGLLHHTLSICPSHPNQHHYPSKTHMVTEPFSPATQLEGQA